MRYRVCFGLLARAGLIAGAFTACGGSQRAAPSDAKPASEKHQCKAGHACGGEHEKSEADGGPHGHVPE